MTSTLNQKNDILEQIFTQLKKHFSAKDQKTLQLFINSVYRDVSIADLTQISQKNLNGLTVSLWREVLIRKGDVAKIRVFNPDVEQDEWQSAHTIITVVCRNIPFVIDTLKLVLNELNIKLHRVFYCEMGGERSKSGKLLSLNAESADELVLYFEIDHTSAIEDREKIEKRIESALLDVNLVVDDFGALSSLVRKALKQSKSDKFSSQIEDIEERSRPF
ncbi:hypothetical protein ACLKMH_21120 [Psychromonas sp. KJ10-10]|uniref:hypothetical protein n=1 Tax=Psychromonas sp. KJ10-10 TaxID=3391823 RepID=UPI0039B3D42B